MAEEMNGPSPEDLYEAICRATEQVFATMLNIEIEPSAPIFEHDFPGHFDGVVSFVGMAGAWIGTGGLSCSASCARRIAATAGSGSPTSWVLQAPSANDPYTVAAGAFGTGTGGAGSSAAITAPSTLAQIAADLNVAGTGYSATLDPTGTILTVTAEASSPAPLATAAPTLASSGSGSVTSLTQLGIDVNNDGTLTFDSSTLDNLLNSNYQDVVNFLQPGNGFTSFGDNFTNTLNNLGNAAPDGLIYLALQSDQSTETTLNTDVTNENTIITQQTQTLTTELNEANYTLTEIPQQLQYVNELYSAISGYNENPNG